MKESNFKDMNTNLIEQTVSYLEELGIYNDFEGVDASLNCSLCEDGFIHSDKYKLSIYVNEYGNLTGLANWSTNDLINAYKEAFESWANLDEFLDFMGCKNWSDLRSDLPGLVLGFNQYYGIQNSILSDHYNNGFETIEEIKEWLLYIKQINSTNK